jgi:NitT/TauT family transport system substrate-binding protein
MSMRKTLARTLVAALLVLGNCIAPAQADTEVVFGTVGGLDTSYLPLFAAEELGYFKEEGITLRTIDFGAAGTLRPQVAAGRVTVGFPNAEPVILSHDAGKPPLPVKFFYNVIRRNVWEMSVLDSSPIKSLRDLKGKTIGIFGFAVGSLPITKAILANAGLTEKDYTFVPVGLGAGAYLALQSGKIDALNLFDVSNDELKALGTKVRIIPEPTKFSGLLSNGFIASDDMLRKDPDTLVKFARAITKGQVVCEINRRACIRVMFRLKPQSKPSNLDGEAAVQYVEYTGNRRATTMTAKRGHYGEYDPQVWRNFIDALHEGGQLSVSSMPIDQLFTNALIPKINAFDYDKIQRDVLKLK